MEDKVPHEEFGCRYLFASAKDNATCASKFVSKFGGCRYGDSGLHHAGVQGFRVSEFRVWGLRAVANYRVIVSPNIKHVSPSPVILNNPGPEKMLNMGGDYFLKELDVFRTLLNSMENQ